METISGLITVILTVLIHDWATARFGFEYNIFHNEFNLFFIFLDLGVWLVIFLPIYFVTNKIFVKKKQAKSENVFNSMIKNFWAFFCEFILEFICYSLLNLLYFCPPKQNGLPLNI